MRRYRNHIGSLVLALLTHLAAAVTVLALGFLVGYVLIRGVPNLNADMFSLAYTSDNQSMLPAILNTCTMTLLALLAGLCCKLPKVLSVVSRLALTAALAVGLCLNGGYLRGVVRTHHAENLAAYQFFVRTIEAGLADAVQSDDLILCNENVWDSNAEAESAFFSRFTGRALHAQVLWTENPATDGDAYAYQTYRNYGGYDLAWCGRLQSADSDLMDGVQVYVQSAYVPDNAVIKYKVRLADGTEEARAICLLDCTQTPRDRNGDYLATVEDTSIVNAKLMIWDG